MERTTYASTAMLGTHRDDNSTGWRRRQGGIMLGLLAAVVVLDQATKWWGWRHSPRAIVNTGATWLIGDPVSGWFSDPVAGRLLDLLGLTLLIVAGYILLRRPRHRLVLVAGGLMISGWSSNLLDRLGMHSLTAPGSARGAIDFIPIGPVYFNLADAVIAAATLLYVVARPSPAPEPATERDEARPLASATSR